MDTLFRVTSRLLPSAVAMTILLSFQLVEACMSNSTVPSQDVISDTKDVMDGVEHIGRIRYHYFDSCVDTSSDSSSSASLANPASRPCSDILMIGVGTAMTVEAYDHLAESIVTKTGSSSLVVVISDFAPGRIVKWPSSKYAHLANAIRNQLDSGILPICAGASDDVRFLIGGHSSSGRAALDAAQKGLYDFVPTGFVGLDPYEISEKTMNFEKPLMFPTLSWGFHCTTCLVQVKKAARGAYQLSSPDTGRVLYSIDNKHDDITHCVFTDHGCGVGVFDVCPASAGNFEWVYESVAESVHLFVNVIQAPHFSKETFVLPSTISGDVALFVNSDIVNAKENTDIDDTCYPSRKRIPHSVDAETFIALLLVTVIVVGHFRQQRAVAI